MRAGAAPGHPGLRAALAAVVVFDLFSFYFFISAARADAATRGMALSVFTDLVSRPVVSAAIIAIGVVAAAAFAYRPGRLWEGAAALAALTLLSSAHAQLFGSPWRHLFYSGLCLAGWLAGLAVSRRSGATSAESYARTGAIAMLGAAYCNAGISKLVLGGSEWVSALPIQSVVVGQDGLIADGLLSAYRAWVVNTPAAGMAFSVATVLFELAGPLMLVGRRARICVAAGLFGMHANIFVLTGILYWESMVLLVLFALSPDPASDEIADTAPRVSAWAYRAAVAGLCLLAVLAIGHQALRYARANAVAAVAPATAVPTPALHHVGPFAVGQTIAFTWSVDALALTADGFVVATSKPGAQARFEISCGASPYASPFDLGAAHIFYSSTLDAEQLEPVGRALQAALRDAAGGSDVCTQLDAWRTAAVSDPTP